MARTFLVVCGGSGINLLGQRRALAVDAELQIDVTEEVKKSKLRQPRRQGDPNSYSLSLDNVAGDGAASTRQLLLGMGNHFTTSAESTHLDFLKEQWLQAQNLSYGLGMSPALGQLAIQQPTVADALDQSLHNMLTTRRAGAQVVQDRNLVVWIISSSAGGTGEGAHRFVAERLIKVARTQYPQGLSLELNFVRVGPMTYESVDVIRTGINTFFGVAADSAFSLEQVRELTGLGVTFNWYFMDLPDVGSGDGAKEPRAKIVEMAVKTLMLPELRAPLNTLQVNNDSQMYLVRVGFWGGDFDNELIYVEALRALVKKLEALRTVDTDAFTGPTSIEPRFTTTDDFDRSIDDLKDTKRIQQKIEKDGWSFPKYNRDRRADKERIGELTGTWRNALQRLLRLDISDLGVQYVIDQQMADGTAAISLQAPVWQGGQPAKYDRAWFNRVYEARRVQVWCAKLLERLVTTLMDLAQACSDVQNGGFVRLTKSSEKRAQELTANGTLAEFFTVLEKVIYLRAQKSAADLFLNTMLDGAETGPGRLLEYAQKQLKVADSGSTNRNIQKPIVAAELNDILDRVEGTTWLGQLVELVLGSASIERFKDAVVAGAIGFTESGLLDVLDLLPSQTTKDIYQKLSSQRGDSRYAAEWWHNNDPPGYSPHNGGAYRILPRLEATLAMRLAVEKHNSDNKINTIEPAPGTIGLNAVVFEGCSISRPGDAVSTPAFLMRPFTNLVTTCLEDWKENRTPTPGTSSGKLTIAKAGGFDSKLFKQALLAAGLSQSALDLLSEFFGMYDAAKGATQVATGAKDSRQTNHIV